MTDKLASGKSVRCSTRQVRFSLWASAAVVSAVLVSISVGSPIPPKTVDRTTSTCLSSAKDNSGRSARTLFASSLRIRDHKDDGSSSELFERRNPASLSDLTKRCLWRMMRLSETHRLSWCIADPAHVNNDFQLDYSAWCSCGI